MTTARRIDVEEARRRVQAGDALLVCAYEDDDKCGAMALEGSIPLSELRRRGVEPDQPIVFYCG